MRFPVSDLAQPTTRQTETPASHRVLSINVKSELSQSEVAAVNFALMNQLHGGWAVSKVIKWLWI